MYSQSLHYKVQFHIQIKKIRGQECGKDHLNNSCTQVLWKTKQYMPKSLRLDQSHCQVYKHYNTTYIKTVEK